MAKQVLTDVFVSLAGSNISSSVASVGLSTTVDAVETTAFGSTSRTRVGGLKDNQVTLSIHQQYSEVEAIVYPLIGSTAQVIIKPNGTAGASSANPSYTFSVLVTEWSPVNGAVGELATADVTWPIDGAITKAVA